MNPLKIILSVLIIILGSNRCLAQNEFEGFSTDIFLFVNKLNNQIDSFFVKEKAESLNRNLGYFENDLYRYLKVRKELLDYLNKNNYKISDPVQVKLAVSNLKKQLNKLVTRLNKIIPDVGNNLSYEARDIVQKIQNSAIANRIVFLSELDWLLKGRNVDTEKLKKEGVTIYNELVKSIELIRTVKTKLKSKFNLS